MIEKRLIDISRNISSGITPLRSNDEFWTDGTIPWLKTEQLGEKYIFDTNEYITEKALQEANVKIFPENTLSIAMYGEGKTRGNVSILKRPMATNQACCNIELDEEKVSSEYVYYFLKTQYENLRGLSSGIRKNLNTNDIKNFVVRLPENLKTQQSISTVLSALDKKIALNKQINARLEEMAKTLYDYWFVQFDFPDANGKPYKSSGGEMVFDETLKREIPKGWEVKSLGEIASTSSGGTPTSTIQEYYKDGNIPWINSGELNNNFIVHTDNFITQTGMDNSSAKLVSEKSILLAMYGTTAGKTSLISFKTTTNQAICSILPKDMNYRVYIKSYLDNMYLYLVQLSSGSARDNLSQDKIKRLHLVIPESGILEIFSKVTEDFYKKIETNLKQNHQLTQLCDFLLPMLMNGQVSVAE